MYVLNVLFLAFLTTLAGDQALQEATPPAPKAAPEAAPEAKAARQDAGQPANAAGKVEAKPVDAAPASETVAKSSKKKQLVPVGEKLFYRGRVKKAGVTVDVGKAMFSVEETESAVILKAHAKGAKFGYSMDTSVTTELRPGSIHPVVHEYKQKGSEKRRKKLVFDDDGATYWKVKHCKTPNCKDPDHMVDHTTYAVGFIPWGSEKRHCKESGCKDSDHRVWRLRKEHTLQQPHVDLLTAIYLARNLEFKPGGKPHVVPVISDRDLWNVKVSARSEKQLKIAAGTFDAVELVLEPQGTGKTAKKASEFDGLFGLNGAIKVWVEKTTRRPLLISGDLPFAFLNLHATIELVKITDPSSSKSSPKPKG